VLCGPRVEMDYQTCPLVQVILSGYSGDHPPADQDGFLEFACSLPALDVYDKLKDATPLTPVMCCELWAPAMTTAKHRACSGLHPA
jgi:hypothetical protein